MRTATWRLIGSAPSLESIRALVIERWGWSTCDALPTDDPKVWQVASGRGTSEGLRFRLAGKRYRFEATS